MNYATALRGVCCLSRSSGIEMKSTIMHFLFFLFVRKLFWTCYLSTTTVCWEEARWRARRKLTTRLTAHRAMESSVDVVDLHVVLEWDVFLWLFSQWNLLSFFLNRFQNPMNLYLTSSVCFWNLFHFTSHAYERLITGSVFWNVFHSLPFIKAYLFHNEVVTFLRVYHFS